MKRFQVDMGATTPLVSATLCGPITRRRIILVFDTGAAITQIHAPTLALVGYTEKTKKRSISMRGAVGETQRGYLVQSALLLTLGKCIEDVPIGAFDFSSLAKEGIDGLLGYDLIKELHLEMDGPKGILKIF